MQEQVTQGQTLQNEASLAYEGLLAPTDWAAAFEILLGVDSETISFQSAPTDPDVKIEASGVLGGLDALLELDAYLGEVDDVLDLLSRQSEEDEEGIRTFSVEIAVM
jgi:hypothetical protein